MTPRLTALQGELLDGSGALQPGDNLVGRSRLCSIRVAASDVSGKHCVIKVTGETVAVENLSQNGTLLDGEPLEFITLLKPGQVLQLGAATQLRFDIADPLPDDDEPTRAPIPTDEEETGKGLAKPTLLLPPPPEEAPTRQAPPPPPPPSPRAAPEPDDVPDMTQEAYDKTRAMETRVLRPEDIEALREAERAKPRQRMLLLVIAGIALIFALFLLWPESKPPEAIFDWPMDAKGNYMEEFIQGPNEDYMVVMPGAPSFKKEEKAPGHFVATTWLSRDFNIPFRLLLDDTADPENLSIDLDTAIRRWIEEKRSREGGWTFDSPSGVNFFGKENGIPFRSLSYTHQEQGSWYGTARIALHKDRLIVLRTEAPYTERIRASDLLNGVYLFPSLEFERSHWSPLLSADAIETHTELRRARAELQRNAPSVWAALEPLLVRICQRAALDKAPKLLQEAEDLLATLREKQRLWFNAQKIARDEAARRLQSDRVRQISEVCKGVFTNPLDRRYAIVRREDW